MCSSRWNKPLELKGQYIPGTRCLLSTHSWHTVPAQCIFLVHSAQSVYIPGTWCPLCAHSWHAVPALCIFLVHGARSVHIPGTQCLLSAYSWYTGPALYTFLAHSSCLVHIPGTRCLLCAYSWHAVPTCAWLFFLYGNLPTIWKPVEAYSVFPKYFLRKSRSRDCGLSTPGFF